MKERLLSLIFAIVALFSVLCPVVHADDSTSFSTCTHDWVKPIVHGYSISIPNSDVSFGVEFEQCSKCHWYKHDASLFIVNATYYSPFAPDVNGIVPKELITYWCNKYYEVFGKNATAKKYETGGGSATGSCTVHFLDVGQGDAAVISTYDGAAYLVDGGGKFGQDFGENVGKRVVLPYLEYLGVSTLDGAFLSHPDSDHMTGLLEVLETVPTKGLYLSDYAFAENEQTDLLKEMVEKYNIPLYTIKTGDSSLEDTFLCLYPTGASAGTGEENQGSMVLRYSYSDTKVLFTGDITAEEEQQLLEQNISADVLKVAHHGSKYSSDAAFLEKVSPKAAVISCGTNNVYGHPHKEAMERLQKTGAEIFRTDEDGTILVTIGKDGAMNIETMTERKPLYENIKEKLEKS